MASESTVAAGTEVDIAGATVKGAAGAELLRAVAATLGATVIVVDNRTAGSLLEDRAQVVGVAKHGEFGITSVDLVELVNEVKATVLLISEETSMGAEGAGIDGARDESTAQVLANV